MLPGFLDVTHSHPDPTPSLAYAGLWESPPPSRCRYARTDTFCTGFVLWCREVSICVGDRDNPLFGHEESKTPYPCGVCVGVTDPSDW